MAAGNVLHGRPAFDRGKILAIGEAFDNPRIPAYRPAADTPEGPEILQVQDLPELNNADAARIMAAAAPLAVVLSQHWFPLSIFGST
jgi:hypothetical protein